LGLSIVTDDRLIERVLCGEPRADWRDLLAASFDDLDACWPGGETSRAAMDRVGAVIREAMESDVQTTALVTHGCLLALALISMDDRYGFEDWQTLKCPDIFRVSARGKGTRISRWYRTK
jgi:2,3-bisphosphoglycerate-dependent phosphoglycerate mutase